MGGIRGAVESVCCLGCMRGVFPQEDVRSSKVDRWGCHMLILLVEVVCWAYVPWGGHRRVECVRALVALGDAWLCHLFGEYGKDN